MKTTSIAIFAALWRFIFWMWNILIIGAIAGVLGNTGYTYTTTGSVNFKDPRTLAIVTWFNAHIVLCVLIFTFILLITLCSFLAHRQQQHIAQEQQRQHEESIITIAKAVEQALNERSPANPSKPSPVKEINREITPPQTRLNVPYFSNPSFIGNVQGYAQGDNQHVTMNFLHEPNDHRTTKDNQQDTILQEYTDKISEFLLEKNLDMSNPNEMVAKVAQERTLIVLARLDEERKVSVLKFLYQLGLIMNNKRILDLADVNLSGVNLSSVNLSHASMMKINLSHANLSNAALLETNLIMANLTGATMSRVVMAGANLCGANLTKTNMRGAILGNVNLTHTTMNETDLRDADLHEADLTVTKYLRNAKLEGAILDGATARIYDLRGANISQEQRTSMNLINN